MAKRRRIDKSDSLELLLDTICNVFGGIVLMAILVVIQTRSTISRIPEAMDLADAALEVEPLRFHLGRLERQVAELRDRHEQLRSRIRSATTPDTAKLLERREQFVREIESAQEECRKLDRETTRDRQIIDELSRQNQDRNQRVEDLQAELTRLAEARKRVLAARTMRVRLPRWHVSHTTGQRIYLIKGSKAHWLGDRWPASEAHVSGHCKVTPLPLQRARLVEPVEGAGVQIAATTEKKSQFRLLLKRDSSRTHLISFFVHADSDSFATFQRARAATVVEGYEYSVAAYAGRGVTLAFGRPPAE